MPTRVVGIRILLPYEPAVTYAEGLPGLCKVTPA